MRGLQEITDTTLEDKATWQPNNRFDYWLVQPREQERPGMWYANVNIPLGLCSQDHGPSRHQGLWCLNPGNVSSTVLMLENKHKNKPFLRAETLGKAGNWKKMKPRKRMQGQSRLAWPITQNSNMALVPSTSEQWDTIRAGDAPWFFWRPRAHFLLKRKAQSSRVKVRPKGRTRKHHDICNTDGIMKGQKAPYFRKLTHKEIEPPKCLPVTNLFLDVDGQQQMKAWQIQVEPRNEWS